MSLSDYSIMIGCDYLGIDIDTQTNRIYGISGYLSLNNLKSDTISLPENIKVGALDIKGGNFIPGIGTDYEYFLKGSYDRNTGFIVLGEIERDAITVKICEDCYFSIKDGKVLAIFIKPNIRKLYTI